MTNASKCLRRVLCYFFPAQWWKGVGITVVVLSFEVSMPSHIVPVFLISCLLVVWRKFSCFSIKFFFCLVQALNGMAGLNHPISWRCCRGATTSITIISYGKETPWKTALWGWISTCTWVDNGLFHCHSVCCFLSSFIFAVCHSEKLIQTCRQRTGTMPSLESYLTLIERVREDR
jgi:hypothetical protein